jgi:hypothetical protein
MNTELLLAALGALLLLAGVLGGGFEIRELKIPQIGRIARTAASLLGLVCILFAIGLATLPKDTQAQAGPVAGTPTPNDQPQAQPVKLRLHDELADGQISEQVTVIFDGRNVGDIKVNQDFPTGMIELTAPKPGTYDYTISSVTEELMDDGTSGVIEGAGQGRLTVQDGGDYDVQFADSGSSRSVTLVSGD